MHNLRFTSYRCSVITWIVASLCSLKVAAVAWIGVVSPPKGIANFPMPWPILPAVVTLCLCPLEDHAVEVASRKAHKEKQARLAPQSDEEEPLLNHSSETASQPTQDPERDARATIGALLRLSAPDSAFLFTGFVFGSVAALGNALIPRYVGKIIGYAALEGDASRFHQAALSLLGVAAVTAVFTGARGAIFSVCTSRLNIRVRERLFRSLMAQEIGYYDTTKTGDITSRLSADTTTMADQVRRSLVVPSRIAVPSDRRSLCCGRLCLCLAAS